MYIKKKSKFLIKNITLYKIILKFYLLLLKKKNYNNINSLNYLKIIKFNKLKKLITNQITNTIHINLKNSNIFFCITNIKGDIIIECSIKNINIKNLKKTHNLNLYDLIKKLKNKTKKLKTNKYALHIKGLKKKRRKILLEFKENFPIKLIKYYNLKPNNGCRPKKKKR